MGESLIIRSGGGVDTSNATATNNQLVEGYTCYVNDELVVGSILIKSPVNKTLYVSQSTNLESGYYVGNDVISTSSLSEETVASSEIVDILTDNNGWANGVFLNGTMVNKGAISQAFGANASYTIPQGWHNGSGKVTQALAVQGAVGITAGTGNQTVCSAGRWTTGEQWVWGDGNLVPWNIKNGVNIFGVWGNFTGWVDPTLQLNGLIPIGTTTENESCGGWYGVVSVSYGKNQTDSTLLARIINTSGYNSASMKFTAFMPGNDRWCWTVSGSITTWAPGDTSFSGTRWRERLNSSVWTSSTETWSFTWSGLQTLNSFSRFRIWAMLNWHKGHFGAKMYDWSAWLSK